MSDTSAPTPEHIELEKIRQWASDWADAYAQDWDEQKLSYLVHKHVKGNGPPEEGVDQPPHGFTGYIIGYSVDTVRVPVEEGEELNEDVHRFSLILASGVQVPIFAGMVIEEVSEDA